MVRICWRRSRGLQVECVASGPRPYWMLLDVPVCHPGCQHLDTLFCLFSAGSGVPCRPAWLPWSACCPPLPHPPVQMFKPTRRQLAGTGRRRRRRGGGPSQRCICNLWEGRMHWQASQDRLDASMLGPECFLTKVWTSLSPRPLATVY